MNTSRELGHSSFNATNVCVGMFTVSDSLFHSGVKCLLVTRLELLVV